jgi:hypothetical protein
MNYFKLTLLLFASFHLGFSLKSQSDLDAFFPKTVESFGTYAVVFAQNAAVPSSVQIKYQANGWSYVLAERTVLYELLSNGTIKQLYREPAQGVALDDSTRKIHHVNAVHQGLNLDYPYTGKNVIMGYVDTGLDPNHPDFKNNLGQTRILRYWNQGQTVNFRTPTKYGYGRVYKSADINGNFNIVGQINQSAHGTTVTGVGSGNGLANGRNKGVAPDCDIIIVRNVLTLPSWSLTVAQGVDYIFSVADSLGKPAVVNLSLGTYLGSHDAKDPAGLYIDSLINQKEGRIVVCAAGNSGAWPAYHVQKELSSDTNFVWMIPNPALAFGSPGVYFDLWADTSNIQNMNFAFGADAPGPIYRGNTTFKQVNFLNQMIQYDTIFGVNNHVIGLVVYQGQVVGPNYNLQTIIYTDSLTYRMRFLATGAGKIDLWSSANVALNRSDFSQTIPDTNIYPEFTNYMMPDTLQSIVSSWACSDQVITVGNVHNRKNYINSIGGIFPVDGGNIPSGILSVNSSKGPSRQGAIKPEIVATGDMTLAARIIGVAYNPSDLDVGSQHIRNGGTSMASPVVAGIAALYLEKCKAATWQNFKSDLINTAFQDLFTGNNVPNNAYGYGKAHAMNILLQTDFNPIVSGNPILCSNQTQLQVTGQNISSMLWNNNQNATQITAIQTGAYFGVATNNKGCKNKSDTLIVTNDVIAPSGSAPADTWVSCLATIPSPNVNSLSNLSDNCAVHQIVHWNDSLHLDSCFNYIERTYRISDEANNYHDVVQTINILPGTVTSSVSNDTVIQAIHTCNGVFIDSNYCEYKILYVDANGNELDYDSILLTIRNEFIDSMPIDVVPLNDEYYQITDGVNTFRVSKKLITIEAPGSFPANGGVRVRFYYDSNEFDAILNDTPNFGTVSNFGWFKSTYHNTDSMINEMNASAYVLSSSSQISPINSGTEQGVAFVEFLVNSFSTFGYFAATQAVPLPVHLSHFNASCEEPQILVTWSTQSEFNASHFQVLSSVDGVQWKTNEQITATGNTNQQSNYQIAVSKENNTQYFKLKQTDFNGETYVYGPISVNCAVHENSWTVHPNPGNEQIEITLNAQEIDPHTKLNLTDLNGRMICEEPMPILIGITNKLLDITKLASGIYFLSISNSNIELPPLKLIVK